MDGFAVDYVPPAVDAIHRVAACPAPADIAPFIAWAVAALILIAGLDLVLLMKGKRP